MVHVVLFEPEIPQNTGNIMRTCAGTATKLHLIKPLGFSLDEKSVKRSGVNYIEKCDFEVYENYEDFCRKNTGKFYFLSRYGTKKYSAFDYSDKDEDIYLIFGKESTGIPKKILQENMETCVRIPINDNIRALNLSNSVAIMLFEVLRQQDFKDLLVYDPFKGEHYLDE
ncbi:MAG: tRNA (cytidine(34)-2'-O)-methyltransferase [Bacilli bacterium]|nr:tRNA (cytidine(34)-2'-O)-methyltransferase [Bacilli bacterium]MDD4547848.1 tRNA (cytidine(34)-2'-O)-methyltransferase [Bacilli bacterium]